MNKKSELTYCIFSALFFLTAFFANAADFYWENPITLTGSDTRFPSVAHAANSSVIVWQNINTQQHTITLSARIYADGQWIEKQNFAGPFSYSGDVPNINSVAVNKAGTIVVTALSGVSSIALFTFADNGAVFLEDTITNINLPLVGARVFALSNDSFTVLATQGVGEAFSLVSSLSVDGKEWSNFSEFAPAKGLPRAFVPTIIPCTQGDLTIFQAAYESNFRLSYQLYSSLSTDGGRTWTTARIVTDSASADGLPFTSFNNQRPNATTINGVTHLVWERTSITSNAPQIFYAPLTAQGTFAEPQIPITRGEGISASQPQIFVLGGLVSVLWTDTRRGIETAYLAQKNNHLWEEERISPGNLAAVFAQQVFVREELDIVWQQNRADGTGRIVLMTPDYTVLPPTIRPVSFVSDKRSTAERVQFQLTFRADSSGIAGYSWIWTQNKDEEPPKTLMALANNTALTTEATQDGYWYLKVRATDYAGNWSIPTETVYYRDTTPPEKPVILQPPLDSSGYAASNTFTVNWLSPQSDDVAGYSYVLHYLSPAGTVTPLESAVLDPDSFAAAFSSKSVLPPARIITSATTTSFTNTDNGMYLFLVSAIDHVGNISEPASIRLFLNKYIPYTIINTINSQTDDTGSISLSVFGRGYLANGFISTIYIDRDGTTPYDRELTRSNGDFTVLSDTLITGITLSDLDEGNYRIGLLHTTRGLYMSRPLVFVDETGTFKFGDYSSVYTQKITLPNNNRQFTVQASDILIAALCLFALLGIVVSARGIVSTAKDTVQIRYEIQALLTGDSMPFEKKEKAAKLSQRGISLKYKLMGFTASQVLLIIMLVSLPLGYVMITTQEETLANGLESQVSVLLESLSSGARAYLPQKNILELGYLPAQSKALPEALYATITGGPASGNNINLDYVWATNDPEIGEKLNTHALSYGVSQLAEPLSQELSQQLADLNKRAIDSAGTLATEIEQLTREALTLVLRTDQASVLRREEIQRIISRLDDRLTTELSQLAAEAAGTFPQFDSKKLSTKVTEYIFYKPVLYRQGADQNFVRGTVRVTVSTKTLLERVATARNNILFMTLIIAVFAITIGIFGSLILASVIIKPIRRLAAHVALIRDTEDKEKLDGQDLPVTSKDEIGILGEIVNDMTHGLVKAAAAAKDLTVGKEVQKMFIPLETDSTGKKLTTGKMINKNLEFFGYYEGAKGVSGDYFDVKELDDRHYAVIKCDVAGKGVPASLIMVEVATLFLDYFKDWTYKTRGYNMSAFVSRVNDLIESRGFKGRFAAFSLCIIDSASGDVHFCNAGDNMLHFYSASQAKKITENIPETPAAGVFPSFMLDMKGGYKMVKRTLKKGDVLFMYTDGIEEAKRMFRDANYNGVICAEPGLAAEAPHESHSVGQASEEMGPERVNQIIEAAFARGTYKLTKWHNPIENEPLDFDFSTCTGTVEDCLMALVSVEKIFRMYRDTRATEHDRVLVDRKVDDFLKIHFKQYANYCSNRRDHSEFAEYLWYTHIKEDPQYDDLTLLGLRKL